MKFTYEDKVEMYRLCKEEHCSLGTIAKQFKCNPSTIKYVVTINLSICSHFSDIMPKLYNKKR